MSLEDIVIDTNVLVHAANPAVGQHSESLALLEHLVEGRCTTELCIDNEGKIISQYRACLNDMDFPLQVVARMAGFGRVRYLGKLKKNDRQRLRKLIFDRNDRVDVIFAETAAVSRERTLVSHDARAFDVVGLKKTFSVRVADAARAIAFV